MPSNTKALKIDLADLTNALEDHSGMAWYLDTESGEVVPVPEDADDDALPVPRDELEESGRFLFVEPIESREGWEAMRDFATTVTDRRLRELLEVALAGKGAFRRFRDVLAGYPEERARWFVEHDRRMQNRAREWLDAHEIAWRPSRESMPAQQESTERGSDEANRQPALPDRARSAGSRHDARCARASTWTSSGSRSRPRGRGSPASR